KQIYKATLTQAYDGVRISNQYAGMPEYEPAYAEADILEIRQSEIDYCLKDFRGCWERTIPYVPFHYSISPEGKVSRPILDEAYSIELKKWMDDEYRGLERYDEFASMMLKDVKSKNDEENLPTIHRSLESSVTHLHGARFVKGEIYTKFGFPLFSTLERYSITRFVPDFMTMELKYLGRTPCHSDDTDKSCAHLEFRLKDRDPAKLMRDTTSVRSSMDVLLEPHSLLLHKVTYEEITTIFESDHLSQVSSRSQHFIDVHYSYEDIPD
ncbi:hypothetical protein OAM69_07140, partial [bacterium]|nr:hypothetical protein [bacterium]